MATAALVHAGERRAVDVVAEALARIAERDDDLRAFREVWPERALRVAGAVDDRIAAGERPALAGVPLGVKAWEKLGSAQVRKLVAAGCVPVGATSVPRGTPWQTWGHTDRGPTRNPWRADRSPGGSSAGSAAAVAAGLVPLATGIDGAGSIRIPAAWCGVVGVKVTGGTAPGPLARSARDAAAYLEALLGPPRTTGGPLTALWSSHLGFATTDGRTVAIARAAADRLFAGGVAHVDHDLILDDPAEAWAARRAGTDATANERQLAEAFERADLILTPATPGPAHGHDGPGDTMNVALTWAFNVSGHPAASVPAGFGPDGVPVGLQIVGRRGAEATILRAAICGLSPTAGSGPG